MRKSSAGAAALAGRLELAVALALVGGLAPASRLALANVERVGPVPSGAAAAIDGVRSAIGAHDFAAVEKRMAARFHDGVRLVPAHRLVADWQASSAELDGLDAVLQDCHGRSATRVVCGNRAPGVLDTEGPDVRAPQLVFELVGKRWLWTTWTR